MSRSQGQIGAKPGFGRSPVELGFSAWSWCGVRVVNEQYLV